LIEGKEEVVQMSLSVNC